MTPPINSVSDERLGELSQDDLLDRNMSPRARSDIAAALTELAARRAANTPVDGWVYLVHDWEINDPGQRGYSYARTPERAERLAKNGVKLTPVYTRHPASEFAPAPSAPSASREVTGWWPEGPFKFGDPVEKAKGSSWHGKVCGWYTTSLTPVGYCVESDREPGSVQLYPAAALLAALPEREG